MLFRSRHSPGSSAMRIWPPSTRRLPKIWISTVPHLSNNNIARRKTSARGRGSFFNGGGFSRKRRGIAGSAFGNSFRKRRGFRLSAVFREKAGVVYEKSALVETEARGRRFLRRGTSGKRNFCRQFARGGLRAEVKKQKEKSKIGRNPPKAMIQ